METLEKNTENNPGNNAENWQEVADLAKENISSAEIQELSKKTYLDPIVNLKPSNDAESKQEFLENPEMLEPNLEYDNLDFEKATENIANLTSALEKLDHGFMPEKERRRAKMSLEDNLKVNKFILANHIYQTSSGAEKELAKELHHQTNEDLYGKADEDTFWSILEEKLNRIPPRETLSPEDQKTYDELMQMLPEIKHSEKGRFVPKPETVERLGEIVNDYFENFFKHIPEDKDEFTAAEAANITNEIIEEELGGETGWQASVNPESSAAQVIPSEKRVVFPGKRAAGNYDTVSLKKILAHEFGTHVMRSLIYEDAGKELNVGPADQETFDEGVAKVMEQGISGKYEDAGLVHYVSIGLATFADKNYREVFEIQKRLEHLTGGWSEKRCLDSTQRTFRGTGELPNNKDLAYYNGANQVWQYVENHLDDPELFDNLFLTGKTNLFNHEEQSMVYEAKTGGYA